MKYDIEKDSPIEKIKFIGCCLGLIGCAIPFILILIFPIYFIINMIIHKPNSNNIVEFTLLFMVIIFYLYYFIGKIKELNKDNKQQESFELKKNNVPKKICEPVMFTLEELVKNKNKREKFIKKFKNNFFINKEEFKLLYRSHKINDIENFINLIGKCFYFLVNNNILEERIPSSKELPEMKYLKKLDCSDTNINEIPYLENLKVLDCSHTNIEKIPKLENLERLRCVGISIIEIPNLENLKYLNCRFTNVKEVPYMPNLKEIYT